MMRDLMGGDPDGPWKEWGGAWHPMRAGPGRTGTLLGHVVPGSCFIGFSGFMLFMALKRARNLLPGESFSEKHIPDKDPIFLKRMGIALIVATFIGFWYEEAGEIINGKRANYHPRAHQVMYLGYMAMGFLGLLEARKKLPPDSGRMCLVICQIVQGIVWYEHAEEKFLMADTRLHFYLSWVCFTGAALVTYSIMNPSSTPAYLFGYLAIFFQGMWMFQAGFYECCMNLKMVGTTFVAHLIVLMIGTGTVIGFFGPDFNQSERAQFSRLKAGFSDEMDEERRTFPMSLPPH